MMGSQFGEDCLRWKCWICSDIYTDSQKCQKCEVSMSDYKGEDVMQILVM